MVAGIFACMLLSITSCGGRVEADGRTAPPPPEVEREQDVNFIKVDHPEQFAITTASEYAAAPQLDVTGAVSPDISLNIPVISLASGRIVEVDARLGDSVKKGQLLMKVQSADIAQAFSDYRQAIADETLSKAQLDRSRLLYEKGAIAQKDLEVAVDADEKAKVTVETAKEKIRVLGADVDHPSTIVNVYAPVSGVIIDQQVTAAAGTQGLASPNPFTIADLSRVWVMCDVYENNLPFVRLGEFADIRLNAYPNLKLRGRIGNIGPQLDPNMRTAKVRLELENPGVLRFGMFVTATFYGLEKTVHTSVPATAVLHLHDRDWAYVPEGNGFRRVEVTGGKMLSGDMQEILSGLSPGQKVVAMALILNAAAQ